MVFQVTVKRSAIGALGTLCCGEDVGRPQRVMRALEAQALEILQQTLKTDDSSRTNRGQRSEDHGGPRSRRRRRSGPPVLGHGRTRGRGKQRGGLGGGPEADQERSQDTLSFWVAKSQRMFCCL